MFQCQPATVLRGEVRKRKHLKHWCDWSETVRKPAKCHLASRLILRSWHGRWFMALPNWRRPDGYPTVPGQRFYGSPSSSSINRYRACDHPISPMTSGTDRILSASPDAFGSSTRAQELAPVGVLVWSRIAEISELSRLSTVFPALSILLQLRALLIFIGGLHYSETIRAH